MTDTNHIRTYTFACTPEIEEGAVRVSLEAHSYYEAFSRARRVYGRQLHPPILMSVSALHAPIHDPAIQPCQPF